MTFEEMQQIIQQMLAVQRELQDSQLKLLEQTQQHERILDRLIKYSLTTELDKLDLEEKMTALERRVRRVENQVGD